MQGWGSCDTLLLCFFLLSSDIHEKVLILREIRACMKRTVDSEIHTLQNWNVMFLFVMLVTVIMLWYHLHAFVSSFLI